MSQKSVSFRLVKEPGAAGKDVQKKPKIDFSIKHVLKTIPNRKPITLNHTCELERKQLLSMLTMSI